MSCNCSQTTQNTSCTCQESSNSICSCPVKDLSTDCVLYTGDTLACSGIVTNTTLSDLLTQLDQFICNRFDQTINNLALISVGTGAEVYKGISGTGAKEIRSVVSEDDTLLDVVQNTDTIGIRAGEHSLDLNTGTNVLSLSVETLSGITELSTVDLNSIISGGESNTASNTGSGVGVFNQKTLIDLEFKSLVAGTNVTLTDLGDSIQIDSASFTTATASSIGTGEDVYNNSSSNPFEFKRIQAKDTRVTVETISDSVVIGVADKIEQIERTTSFSLDDTMNEQVVFINNGANNITITVPTLANNFKAGFVQLGTGEVDFIASGVTVITKDGLKIQDQNYQAFIQKINSSGDYILLGNTKV